MSENATEVVARKRFFFPPQWSDISGHLPDVLSVGISAPFQQFGEAFRRNVLGCMAMMAVPFRMAVASLHQRRHQAIHTAEAIRARAHLRPDGTVPDWAKAEAAEVANRRIRQEWNDPEQQEGNAKRVLLELGASLADEEMDQAAGELLRQGVVATWGSLEVFVRDYFVALLNSRSEFAVTLTESEKTRRLFDIKSVSFGVLALHGFNVRLQLGNLFAQQHDLDSVPSMKSVFGVLFPENVGLRKALDDRQLWALYQRRNLIAHRRGVVDKQYCEATGDDLPTGSELAINPGEVEGYIRCCCEVVAQLLTEIKPGSPEVLG